MRERVSPPPRRKVALLRLEVGRHRLADLIATVRDVSLWPFAPGVAPPTTSAITRTLEVVLAVGPLQPGGPAKVIVGPSVRGGVVVTFCAPQQRDVTIASLNNHTSLLVLGKGWTGELQVEELSHADAVTRARTICRLDDAAPPGPSSPAD